MNDKPINPEEFERDFPFEVLWQDEEEANGMAKILPWISIVVNIIILILLIVKK